MSAISDFAKNGRFKIRRLDDYNFIENLAQLNGFCGCDYDSWVAITDTLDTKKIYIVPQAEKSIKLIFT